MTNKTISALSSASTIVGTEVLPIVQSSATVKVSVANLTSGLGTIVAAKGGTGQTSYAVGDLLYADTTTSLAKLPDVATGNALISGGVSTAPSWGKIGLTTHVSGTLPVANGGTNLTSFTANGLAYASSTSALATGSAITFDGTNFSTTGTATALGFTGSSASSSIGTNTASSTYCNIVTMSTLTANTMYQYFITINATDASYLAVGYVIYTTTTNILIPLYSGGTAFSATSGTVDVRISGGVLQYQQKSGGLQAIAWNVYRTFTGR